MKGILKASLLVVVGVAGLAQGYVYQARGLSDIIAALEGGKEGKGAPAVTKEITKTVTQSIQGAAAPTGAIQYTQTITEQFTVTMNATQMSVVTSMVTMTLKVTEISVVTSMATMTMMVSGPCPVPSYSRSLTEAAIQEPNTASITTPVPTPAPTPAAPEAGVAAGVAAAPALGAAQVAQQPNVVDINTLSLTNSLDLGNLAVATAV